MKKHTIIYAHGFGVRKDDRGLFTDIAKVFPDTNHIMFDLDICDNENNTVTIRPFSQQVSLLNNHIKEASNNSENTIDIVAHSRGCKVVASADLSNIRKVIFITPPIDISTERTLERFHKTPDAVLNMEGDSRLPRKDGTVTIFPKEYWTDSESNRTLIEDYISQSENVDALFIKAKQDDILGDVDLNAIESKGKVLTLNGDHNFSGDNREGLVEVIEKFIN